MELSGRRQELLAWRGEARNINYRNLGLLRIKSHDWIRFLRDRTPNDQGRPSLISVGADIWISGNEKRAKDAEKEKPANIQNLSSRLRSLRETPASHLNDT